MSSLSEQGRCSHTDLLVPIDVANEQTRSIHPEDLREAPLLIRVQEVAQIINAQSNACMLHYRRMARLRVRRRRSGGGSRGEAGHDGAAELAAAIRGCSGGGSGC